MTDWLGEFHFLRPAWLLTALPLAWLLWRFRRTALSPAWRRVMDPALLDALVADTAGRRTAGWWLATVAGMVAIIALAGPTWQRMPQPVYASDAARVLVLDLSRSMDAADIAPSRMARARFAARDLLAAWPDGRVGVVAFAGDAHAVVPLTQDHDTARHLVASLDTDIMPVQGSNIAAGLRRAGALLDQGVGHGADIVLLTDSEPDAAALTEAKTLRESGHRLAIVGFGTPDGAPVPSPNGGWLRRANGSIVIAGLDAAGLRQLARAGGGDYQTMPATTLDAESVVRSDTPRAQRTADATEDRWQTDQWQDAGVWLTLFLLPLGLLAFRRNGLAGAVVLATVLHTQPAHAVEWESLWRNPDQRGHDALQADDPDTAAQLFRDAHWQAVAAYRAEDYAAAAAALAEPDTATQAYNRGNALARAGDLDAAIAAYDQAAQLLDAAPTEVPADLPADIRHNRELVKRLREQQSDSEGDPSSSEPSPAGQDNPQSSQQDNAQSQDGQGQEQTQSDPSQSGQPSDPTQRDKGESAESESDGASDSDAAADDSTPAQTTDTEPGETTPDDPAVRQAEAREQAEREQALAQWLRRVPDDPGGLLRRKFQREQQRRSIQGDTPARQDEEPAW